MNEAIVSPVFQAMFNTSSSNKAPHDTDINFEALARLTIGDTVKPPQYFISSYEQRGQMSQLFHIVSTTACGLITAVKTTSDIDLRVSINIDQQTLITAKTASRLHETIKQHDLSPHNIKLELLEQGFNRRSPKPNLSAMFDTLSELQDIGFSLSMDDFGSEESNANRYFELKSHGIIVDTIKLDRSLMPSQHNNAKDNNNAIRASGLNKVLKHIDTQAIPTSFVLEGAKMRDIDFYRNLIGEDHSIYAQGFDWAMPQSFDRTIETCSQKLNRNISIC